MILVMWPEYKPRAIFDDCYKCIEFLRSEEGVDYWVTTIPINDPDFGARPCWSKDDYLELFKD